MGSCVSSLPSEVSLGEKTYDYRFETVDGAYSYPSSAHSTDSNILSSTVANEFPTIFTEKRVEKLIAGYIRYQIIHNSIPQHSHKSRSYKVFERLIANDDYSSSFDEDSSSSSSNLSVINLPFVLRTTFITRNIPTVVKQLIIKYFPIQNFSIYCTMNGKFEELNKFSRLMHNEYDISYNYNTLLLTTIDCNVYYFNQFGRRNILNDDLIKCISMSSKHRRDSHYSSDDEQKLSSSDSKHDFVRLISYGIAARHVIFITKDNELYAIGNNTHGQFGGYSTLPVVKLATKWTWLQSYSRSVFHSRTIVKIATGMYEKYADCF